MKGFVIGAERSGSGKTTITTGIIRALSDSGTKVAPFKCGPDYIDTRHLSKSAGHAAENLDTVMLSDKALRRVFTEGCSGRDIAVVEGVMGFFDGINHENFQGSTYNVAAKLGLPAVIVLNAASCSYTLTAILKGIKELAKDAQIAGYILNNIASTNHENLIRNAVTHHTDLQFFGSVPKQAEPLVKSRHLGIKTALETDDEYYEKCGSLVTQYVDIEALAKLETAKTFETVADDNKQQGKICAVAYDEAFNFYYEANLRELKRRGYELKYFSPLKGEIAENADFIYIGGGYPELYVRTLSNNTAMLKWLKSFSEQGGAMLCECGGMMLLTEGLTVGDKFYPLAGVFKAESKMTERRQALGYVKVTDNPILNGLVGHEFHYSKLENVREDYFYSLEKLTSKTRSADGFYKNNTLAGYAHFHFLSEPSVLDFILR
jgi:cobyrinic acid a,c-diamide synthase